MVLKGNGHLVLKACRRWQKFVCGHLALELKEDLFQTGGGIDPHQGTAVHRVLVIHITDNLARKTTCCTCTYPLAAWNPRQLIAAEKPSHCSLLVPAIASSSWPCLHLKVQKEVLKWAYSSKRRVFFFVVFCCFCFFKKNYIIAWTTRKHDVEKWIWGPSVQFFCSIILLHKWWVPNVWRWFTHSPHSSFCHILLNSYFIKPFVVRPFSYLEP